MDKLTEQDSTHPVHDLRGKDNRKSFWRIFQPGGFLIVEKMTDSQRLLAEYVTNGSESAFRGLVTRYLDLVYATAVRLVGGDAHLAEDVAQAVFVALAQKARTLPQDILLGGWLHRHTCYVAATIMRGERRRHLRERQAVEMNALPDHSETNLAQVAPILDEAINQLGADDRAAILLRFYEHLDLRSVAEAMGSSENAAQKRLTRALEKLHSLLKHRGVAPSAAALGTALAGATVTAAPAGLAASISGTALASPAGTGAALTILKLMAMTKLKLSLIGAVVVAGVATPLLLQHSAQVKLREENASLRQQIDQMGQLSAENERLSNIVAQAKGSPANDQLNELLRLRGQVGMLRDQTNQLGKLREENRRLQASLGKAAQEPQQSGIRDPWLRQLHNEGRGKVDDAKALMLAFRIQANENQGQFPTNLDQVLKTWDEAHLPALTGTNQFEMVYQGSLQNITNPGSVIVIRDKQAWQASDGNWYKVYGFDDGSATIYKGADGNFDAFEKQHIFLPSSTNK